METDESVVTFWRAPDNLRPSRETAQEVMGRIRSRAHFWSLYPIFCGVCSMCCCGFCCCCCCVDDARAAWRSPEWICTSLVVIFFQMSSDLEGMPLPINIQADRVLPYTLVTWMRESGFSNLPI